MNLNPNHPVLQAVDEHWQKIAALLVSKAGGDVTITTADIAAAPPLFLAVRGNDTSLRLYLVDEQTARSLARKEGGLPQ